VSSSLRYAEQKNIQCIDSIIFSFFSVTSLRSTLCDYFPEQKVTILTNILSDSLPSEGKRKTSGFESIEMSKELFAAVKKSSDDPDN
jgi:hypothetical protein